MISPFTKDLISEIGREVVLQTAPQELPIFQAASEAYFVDPRRALAQRGSKDEVLGFGLESLGLLLTPLILQLSAEVLEFLTDVAKEAVASGLKKGVSELVGAMFRRRAGPATSILTASQIVAARKHGLLAAKRLKVPPEKAELIINAITNQLATK